VVLPIQGYSCEYLTGADHSFVLGITDSF
jgi:hypothetical protein